ncbi:MAG: ankyrin repeat domain-containing protein [Bacteroidales bacterium]|nr:ankyrin repeat domain-containing protein [Bacteroidales bacterium]
MNKIKHIFCADKDFCALAAKQNEQNKWNLWGYSGELETGEVEYGFRMEGDYDAIEATNSTTGRTIIKVLKDEKWSEIVFIQTPKVAAENTISWRWLFEDSIPKRLLFAKTGQEDESLDSLLERGAGIKTILIDLVTALSFSGIPENSTTNELSKMNYFLKNGIDVNQKDEWGNTALHHACHGDNYDIVKLLLENGVAINEENNLNHTALSNASISGKMDIIELLLAHGANINFEKRLKKEALNNACNCSDYEMTKWLLENGTDVNGFDYKINDINWEDWGEQIKIMKLLADKNVNVNTTNDKGMTTLMHLVDKKWYGIEYEKEWNNFEDFIKDQKELICQLLDSGADINAKCNNGKTALHYALDYKGFDHGIILKTHPYQLTILLLEKGADINASDKNGTTALMLAIASDLKLVSKHLIKQGIDLNAKDHIGRTALTFARQWQSKSIYDLLRKKMGQEQTIPTFSELNIILPFLELESLLGVLQLPCSFSELIHQCRSNYIPQWLVVQLDDYLRNEKDEIDQPAMERFKEDMYNEYYN